MVPTQFSDAASASLPMAASPSFRLHIGVAEEARVVVVGTRPPRSDPVQLWGPLSEDIVPRRSTCNRYVH